MLHFDKNFLKHLNDIWAKKIWVFFYEAGCSGTKVDIKIDDFDEVDLIPIVSSQEREQSGFQIYVKEEEKEKFEWARITRTVIADHTGQEKIRYILSHPEVKERCGCGSSFSFEKKVPKLNLEKLKDMKKKFQ